MVKPKGGEHVHKAYKHQCMSLHTKGKALGAGGSVADLLPQSSHRLNHLQLAPELHPPIAALRLPRCCP